VQIPVITPLWNTLVGAIFYSLAFFYQYLGSAGLAIIALTVAVRILLIPLTWKQTKSMVEMQRIQPKIKELQAKYKKDPEKLQQETMKFYQENKVNPFGGCLPLIIQMPVFIALYQVLSKVGNPTEIAKMGLPTNSPLAQPGQSFYAIIPDIAKTAQQVFDATLAHGVTIEGILAMLPYVVLILLFAVSIYVPQMMTTTDPQQRRIGLIMAVMFLWFGWLAPAGVMLYWVTSSAWQVGQQWITMRMMNRPEGAEAK
jgi:YidC/Oxa1 family membrane protein insertase